MGKKNNQNFVQIPHFRLIQMLQYKAETEGIEGVGLHLIRSNAL
jgi:IS605 OrfB family transposase